MRFSTFLILACMAGGIAFLSSLGFWQLQRLSWKEDLIAKVESRREAAPISLSEVERVWNDTKDVNFIPLKVSGTFDHTKEQFYYVTLKGQVGYHVYTPLKLEDGRTLIVNRGFVPNALKDPNARVEGQLKGIQNIIGLARNAPTKKPNSFVPENDLAKNIYHWKSHKQMAAQMNLNVDTPVSFVSFFVDVASQSNQVAFPKAGTTRIEFPNSHLSYALTWFGLAFALLGVGSYFLYSRRKSSRVDS